MKFIHSFLVIALLSLGLSAAQANAVLPSSNQQEEESLEIVDEDFDFDEALAELDGVPKPTLKQHIKLAWMLTKNAVADHPVLATTSGVVVTAGLIATIIYLVKCSKSESV